MRKFDGGGDGLGLLESLLNEVLGLVQDPRLCNGVPGRWKFRQGKEVVRELRIRLGLGVIPDANVSLFLPPPVTPDIFAQGLFIPNKIQEIVSDLKGQTDMFPHLL